MVAAQKTITIMQPYFMPYAGYFRLFLAGGVFVLYDDVQFKKGGWIHRNRLMNANGEPAFLTLPIKRMPLGTSIRNMEFQNNAQALWEKRLRQFPALGGHRNTSHPLLDWLYTLSGNPVEFIMKGLEISCAMLDIPYRVVRSSTLDIPGHLRGMERIIHIVTLLGGNRYINAPQGRALYDEALFRQHGIELDFLPDYNGDMMSILHRLLTENSKAIRAEIEANL